MSAAEHFTRLLHLLDLETQAETQQLAHRVATLSVAQAEASGYGLGHLVPREGQSGLGGRFLLTLTREANAPLPWHRLGPGSPVWLSAMKARHGEGQRGVVSRRDERSVQVALDEPPDDEDASVRYRLDIAPDEAARDRMRHALEQAARIRTGRLADLRDVLLGERPPRFDAATATAAAHLNAQQNEAIALALAARDVAVIHGPPGTGKTTTVVELIRQAVRRGERVLVCAPSNMGVDNVLERLIAAGERAVRLGHPARVMADLREHTLDLLAEDHPDTRAARKLAKEAFGLFRQAGKWTRAKPQPGEKQALRHEARALLADARRMENLAIARIVGSSPIVLATLTGLDDDVLGDQLFDLLVIDEACQSTEPAAWIALARARRVVLAGDHCQLPPTVLSVEAERAGFGVSLLERLVALHGATITRRLEVQYRMHEAIMGFSSAEFYDGSLVAHESVRHHLLRELPEVADSDLVATPLTLIDTSGASYDEEKEDDGESKRNPQEAELAVAQVRKLWEAGVRDLAVIAPYAAQVRLLRRLLADLPEVEIDSVDGFQGREKEAIVYTLVRSNAEGEIGFLGDTRRTNVALTRARRKLIVIGDLATLAHHPFYARLGEYVEAHQAHRSVWDSLEM
jgi:superfamily I DNA and/or RNA helicase